MDKNKALQKLLNGTATKKEIESLKEALASGEISIGGDMNRSVVIIGSGNKVELTAEALGVLKPEAASEAPAEGESPYMGLKYFDTADSELFFGREALTRELAERVSNENLLAIVGASGSGKSSVARAGLIPGWKKENERGLVHVITPTAQPLESLAASLTRESESVTATSTLMDDLTRDARSLWLYIRKMLSNTGKTNLLLVIDQFEETFTLCKDPAMRKAFIENLTSLADENNNAARVVLTLRADFYHRCAEYEGLRLMLEKHQAFIGAMTQDELREAIVQPAERNGWDFQPGLVDLILQDVGTEPGALPLLSHALLETWKRRQGRALTLQGYHDAGGVKKAITQTAENVYDKLSPSEQTAARNIFLRLTELGEGVQDTRRRANLDELGTDDAVRKVIKTLTDARLVTTEQDSAEVAHEALIREWGTLRKWLDEDRESLRLHRQITESSTEWERSGRDETFLVHRGGRLESALSLNTGTKFGFSRIEEEYLGACVTHQDKGQREKERRSRVTVITSTAMSVIFLMLAVFGFVKSEDAKKQALISRASELSTLSANEQEENITLALLLGIEAIKTHDYYQTRKIMLENFQITKQLRKILTVGDVEITSVAYSPDGKTIAYATYDQHEHTGSEIILMNYSEQGLNTKHLTDWDPFITSIKFNSDGSLLLSGGAYVTVWDIKTGDVVCRTGNYGDGADFVNTSIAFSPDSRQIAYAKSNGDVYLTTLEGTLCGNSPPPLYNLKGGANSIAFNPTGNTLAIGGDDHTLILLDISSQEVISLPTGHSDQITSLSFNAKGNILATGSKDKSIILWDMNTHTKIGTPLLGHTGAITDLSFSPDGKVLASSSNDKTIILWAVNNFTALYPPLVGHTASVTGVSFAPDSHQLVSGGLDGNIALWDIGSHSAIESSFSTKIENISQLAISSDGKTIGVGRSNGNILFVDVESQKIVEANFAHSSSVTNLKFNNNGDMLVSSSCYQTNEQNICSQNEIILWGIKNKSPIDQPLLLNPSDYMYAGITSMGFSPDDNYLVMSNCGLQDRNPFQNCNLGEIVVLDTNNKKVIGSVSGVNNYSIAFSPNTNYFIQGGCELNTFAECQKGILWLSLLMPDGLTPTRPFILGRDWDWIIAHNGSVHSLEFSPDGNRLASGSDDGSILIWDTSKLQHLSKLPLKNQYFYLSNMSLDKDDQPVQQIGAGMNKHEGAVTSLSFSPDGTMLVSSGNDNKVILWDVISQQLMTELPNRHSSKILASKFTPDGKYLIAGKENGEVTLWNVNIDDWIELSCSITGRNLTRAEWSQYFPNEEYRKTCDQWPLEPEAISTPQP